MIAVAGFAASYLTGVGLHLEDLELPGCHKTFRPLVNKMYHLTYAWVVCVMLGWLGRWIIGYLDTKYSAGPVSSAA